MNRVKKVETTDNYEIIVEVCADSIYEERK